MEKNNFIDLGCYEQIKKKNVFMYIRLFINKVGNILIIVIVLFIIDW